MDACCFQSTPTSFPWSIHSSILQEDYFLCSPLFQNLHHLLLYHQLSTATFTSHFTEKVQENFHVLPPRLPAHVWTPLCFSSYCYGWAVYAPACSQSPGKLETTLSHLSKALDSNSFSLLHHQVLALYQITPVSLWLYCYFSSFKNSPALS